MPGKVATKYREKRNKFLRAHSICGYCLKKIEGHDQGVDVYELHMVVHVKPCLNDIVQLRRDEMGRLRQEAVWARMIYAHREAITGESS